MKNLDDIGEKINSLHARTVSPPLLVVRDALVDTLSSLDTLLADVPQRLYVQNPAGAVRSGMGPHVRHALDHVTAWLGARVRGQLDYDTRARGTEIEHDPRAAQMCIANYVTALKQLDHEQIPPVWRLLAQVSEGGPSLAFDTTPERELTFVLSHTIHHMAILAIMSRELGIHPPSGFGYAPATRSYLAQQSQAAASSQ